MDQLYGIDVINIDTGERNQYSLTDQQTAQDVANLQNTMTEFRNTLDGMNTIYKQLKQSFNNLNSNFDSLSEEVTGIESDLQDTNLRLTQLQPKFMAFEESLTPITAGVTVNSDYAVNMVDNSFVSGKLLFLSGYFYIAKDVPNNSLILTVEVENLVSKMMVMSCGSDMVPFLINENGEVRNQKAIDFNTHTGPFFYECAVSMKD